MKPNVYLRNKGLNFDFKLKGSEFEGTLQDLLIDYKQQLILSGVVKSFTAEEVVNELKENETLDDAISFFTNIK